MNRTDPPHSVVVTPGDQRLQVSWLPSRGPTPHQVLHRLGMDSQREQSATRETSEAEVEGIELGNQRPAQIHDYRDPQRRDRYRSTSRPSSPIGVKTMRAGAVQATGVSPMKPPVPVLRRHPERHLSVAPGVPRAEHSDTPRDFDSATTKYTLTVPRDTSSMSFLSAYVNEVNATYVVEGVAVAPMGMPPSTAGPSPSPRPPLPRRSTSWLPPTTGSPRRRTRSR